MSRLFFRRLFLILPFTILPSCAQVEHGRAPGLADRTPPARAVAASADDNDAIAVARTTAAAAVNAAAAAEEAASAAVTLVASVQAEPARSTASQQGAPLSSSGNITWLAATSAASDVRKPSPGETRTASYQTPPAPLAPPASESDEPLPLPAPIQVEGALSLADIEEIAQVHNPTLAQAEAAITGAEGQYIQGGLYPNPQVGYQASEIGNDGKAGQQGAYVSQTFVTGGKLELNQYTAAREIEARQQDLEAQRQRVLTSVRIGFYDVLNAQRAVTLSEQLVKISEEGVKTAQALFDAKQAGRVDLLQAKIELNSARVLLRNATNRQTAAWQQLAAVLGQPDRPIERVGGELEPAMDELGTDAVMARIMSASPELQAANAQVERARAALRRAEVEPIPDIQTQTGVQYDYGSQFAIVGLQVGVNLPIFNKNEGNIQTAYAEMIAAQREVERLQLDLKNRLAVVMEGYQNATYEVERYSTEILPDAKDSLELITAGYTQGEFDYNRLLLAQRTYFQNNINYLAALREWWTAKLQIDGLLLSGGLSRAD
tara:strand:- start:49824 stop:51464 length:1641 start_codon:yes stop_codon:yes gene_type:complete